MLKFLITKKQILIASEKFFAFKKGLHVIIESILNNINKNNNYKYQLNTNVTNITYNNKTKLYDITYNNINKIYKIQTKYIVCAIPHNSLLKLSILKPYHEYLNSVKTFPIIKVFEIYNSKKDIKSLKKIKNKIITNHSLINCIFPIKAQPGLILSAYVDTKEADKWHNLYNLNFNKFNLILDKESNKILSAYNINLSTNNYIKFWYWKDGKANWKKNIDSELMQKKIINLLPNFYICGSNYSLKQAWCEGALETSELVLKQLYKKLTKYTKKNKIKYNKTKKQI